jgi:hypothetical protein
MVERQSNRWRIEDFGRIFSAHLEIWVGMNVGIKFSGSRVGAIVKGV